MRPQQEFVAAVLDHLDMTQTELGVELRKSNAYATVHGWMTGTKKLGYEDTMRMLELCGWLNIAANAQTDAGIAPDPLERIAAGVTELLRDQKKILGRLPAARPAPQQSPGRDQTKPKKAAKR